MIERRAVSRGLPKNNPRWNRIGIKLLRGPLHRQWTTFPAGDRRQFYGDLFINGYLIMSNKMFLLTNSLPVCGFVCLSINDTLTHADKNSYFGSTDTTNRVGLSLTGCKNTGIGTEWQWTGISVMNELTKKRQKETFIVWFAGFQQKVEAESAGTFTIFRIWWYFSICTYLLEDSYFQK